MKKRSRIYVLLASAVVIGPAAFVAGRVWAGGIPASGALTYSGTLTNATGEPLTGEHPLQINFWSSAKRENTPLCQTLSSVYTLEAGHFAVALPDTCVDAIKGNTQVWAEVVVDGVSLGTSKLGAVPYAIEAGHAISADSASAATGALETQLVPPGAVVPFDLESCPAGWTELMEARGRTVVGTGPGLERGTAVGSNAVALSVGQLPAHTHTGTTGTASGMQYRNVHQAGALVAVNHFAGWSNGGYADYADDKWPGAAHVHTFTTAAAGGGQVFDNRQESLPLLYCRKN